MTRIVTLFLALLIGCTGESMIPQDEACQEQADTWCTHAGFGSAPGCNVWYHHQCWDHAPNGAISEHAQNACLDAIVESAPGSTPTECTATWGAP